VASELKKCRHVSALPRKQRDLPRNATALAVLLLVALIISACSTSQTSSGSAAFSKSRTSRSEDLASAKAALLQLADLPTGWTAAGIAAAAGSSDSLLEPLAECIGAPTSAFDVSAPAEVSPTFSPPKAIASVQDEVNVYPTTRAAAANFSTFSNPKMPHCLVSVEGGAFGQEIAQSASAGTTIGTITGSRQSFPKIGENSSEIQLVFPTSNGNSSVPLYFELIAITKGRTVSTLTLFNAGGAFDPSLAEQLATAAASHMS
jgi:hypothetical protein